MAELRHDPLIVDPFYTGGGGNAKSFAGGDSRFPLTTLRVGPQRPKPRSAQEPDRHDWKSCPSQSFRGLKPRPYSVALRGAEAPLFHGGGRVWSCGPILLGRWTAGGGCPYMCIGGRRPLEGPYAKSPPADLGQGRDPSTAVGLCALAQRPILAQDDNVRDLLFRSSTLRMTTHVSCSSVRPRVAGGGT
jgi:hypothetical protein